jgi:hypothetical protein
MELFLVVIALYSVAVLLLFGWHQRTLAQHLGRGRPYQFQALTRHGRGPTFVVTAYDLDSAFEAARRRAEAMKTDDDEIVTVGLV